MSVDLGNWLDRFLTFNTTQALDTLEQSVIDAYDIDRLVARVEGKVESKIKQLHREVSQSVRDALDRMSADLKDREHRFNEYAQESDPREKAKQIEEIKARIDGNRAHANKLRDKATAIRGIALPAKQGAA